jgi:hypothetical protein
LGIGGTFEGHYDVSTEWVAIVVDVRGLSAGLRLVPGSWKGVFRIISDPKRLNLVKMSEEELKELRSSLPHDYYGGNQEEWFYKLDRIPSIQAGQGKGDFLDSCFGLRNACFDGSGRVSTGITPARIYFLKNVPLATLSHKVQDLGTSSDGIVLE